MAIRALFQQLYASELARRSLLGLLIVVLFLGGDQLRRWTGEKTRHVRFQHDIVNGFRVLGRKFPTGFAEIVRT